MAITYVSGTLTSLSVNTDAHIIDMENEIFLLDPQASPFTIFLNKIGKERAKNTEVKCLEWRTKEYIVYASGISAAVTSCVLAVSIGGSGALYVQPGDVVWVPTWGSATKGEHLFITDAGSGGTCTFTRAFGAGEDVAATTASARCTILADAKAEGAAKRSALRLKSQTVTNFTQIMETLCSLTKSELAMASYGGDTRKMLQKHMGIEHQLKKERNFIYSKNVTAAVTTRTMIGMKSFVTSNIYDFTGATAGNIKSKLGLNILKPAFDHSSSSRKLLLAGSYLINQLDAAAMGKLQLTESVEFYGLKILNQIMPFGECVVAYHRQLNPDECLIIDLQYVREAYLRALVLNLNVETPGTDSIDDQYIEETTLRVKLEECHGFGYSVPSTT